MKDLTDKVAVVTGAASGIGHALARRFATAGMKVVLADIEAGPLARAAAELTASGATCLAVPTDVADGAAVDALARAARAAFGAVHVLCNNAGVGGGAGPMWTLSQADWEWTLGVNLWSVIHGIRAFVPDMIAQGGEAHVVNTASIAGLTANPFMGPYTATKHAVVAISEVLAKDLALAGAHVKVSVLCPGFVRTGIAESERNRPARLANPRGAAPPGAETLVGAVKQLVSAGMPPEEVAERVLAAVHDERFYVLTHPEMKGMVQARLDEVLAERTPQVDPLFAQLLARR